MSYSQVFLSTYRYFLTSHELFASLVAWYKVDDDIPQLKSDTTIRKTKKLIQARSLKILINWISNHWHDFNGSKRLMAELDGFVEYLAKASFTNNQKLLHAIREQVFSID